MTRTANDPLLATVRVLLTVLLALFGIGLVALIAALVALPFLQSRIIDLGLANGVSSWDYTGRVVVMMLGIGIFLASGFLFTLLLRRIIDTVAAGDPFGSGNAKRLQIMGYCVIAITVGAMAQPFISAWVNELLQPSDRVEIYSFSADGLLLALVLFILARVFRHGAAMRDDLEGTV